MRPDPTISPEARLPSDGVGGSSSVSPPRGKPKRKAIPVKVQVAVAIRQANEFEGLGVHCPLCKYRLWSDQPRVLEHMVPRATRIALGLDPDCPSILAWVHKECADKKTNGTKATCADGDLHKIAKAKRLERAREAHRAALAGEREREPGKIKGRGLSHPTLRRTMSGKVVAR